MVQIQETHRGLNATEVVSYSLVYYQIFLCVRLLKFFIILACLTVLSSRSGTECILWSAPEIHRVLSTKTETTKKTEGKKDNEERKEVRNQELRGLVPHSSLLLYVGFQEERSYSSCNMAQGSS